MLDIHALTKSFGGNRAVDGASFHVRAGGITGLIGPNGAGKTTTFNCVAGLHHPGRRIDGMTPDRVFRAGLARTFQIPRPFPEMSVLDNVMLSPIGQSGERFWMNWIAPGRVAREERENLARARHWIDFVGLGALAESPARVLSGGQRKLLELARVMVAEPRLVLLDEPGAGVNPALLDLIVEKIATLNRQGVTFLLIEHNMDLVMSLCDPIVVMAQGAVLMEGDAAAVRADPRVVEAYLGGVAA
jgi:branched-chain amino acid transport system ATP-binding protein